MTRKRNDNPLKDEDISLHETKVEVGEDCCSLCEVDLTNTKAFQQSDKHCIRIAKLLENPRNMFHKRESYGYDDTCLLYHIHWENSKEYNAMVFPKTLIKTMLQAMHDHFGHFGIGKTYSLITRYYSWPKMIKHIQSHADSCSLCQREKMQADKFQLRPQGYYEELLQRYLPAWLWSYLPPTTTTRKYWWWWIISLDGPLQRPYPTKRPWL